MTIFQHTQNVFFRTAAVRIDRLLGLLALLAAMLFLADRGQALESLRFVGAALLQIAPFFIVAVGFAAFAKTSGIDRLIARAPIEIDWRFWRERAKRGVFLDQLGSNGFFLGKWMALAFFIESLMIAYLPADAIAGMVGSENAIAIPLAALVGIPAYMNGYAAIPMVSGLLALGMTPGAALSFVTAGAVSSIPAALAVYALVRRPVFVLYVMLGTLGAVGAGYLYQLLLLV